MKGLMGTLRFECARALLVIGVGLAASTACGDRAAERAAAASKARALAEEAEAKTRADAAAARDAQRLAALWNYHDVEAGTGQQLTATIASTENVDTGGNGFHRAQLVFRDHPSWGRSSYLVLQAGDFDCYRGCSVAVTVDDGTPTQMAARRPRTDEAIAMFINDWRALWRMTAGAARIGVEFPVRAGGTRTASFEVAGLDRSKMSGWDELTTSAARPNPAPAR
jgi:hypothetical protein